MNENLTRYENYKTFCKLNNLSPCRLESLTAFLMFEKGE